nr:hypothetical protein [Streptomyces sp. SID5464]
MLARRLAEDPDDVRAWVRLACSHLGDEKVGPEALEATERAPALDSEDIGALVMHAHALRAAGRFLETEDVLNEVIRLAPEHWYGYALLADWLWRVRGIRLRAGQRRPGPARGPRRRPARGGRSCSGGHPAGTGGGVRLRGGLADRRHGGQPDRRRPARRGHPPARPAARAGPGPADEEGGHRTRPQGGAGRHPVRRRAGRRPGLRADAQRPGRRLLPSAARHPLAGHALPGPRRGGHRPVRDGG